MLSETKLIVLDHFNMKTPKFKNRFGLNYQLRLGAVFILFVLLHATLRAASVNLDSLESVIAATPYDTAKIRAYIIEVEKLRGTDMDRAMEKGKKAIGFAEKSKNWTVQGYALNSMGNTYSKRGNYELAIDFYQQAIRAFQKTDRPADIAKVYLNLGSNYLNRGNDEQAALWLNKADDLVQANPDIPVSLRASLYHNLAMVSTNRKDYDEALSYYRSALELAEKDENLRDQALTLNNIGYTLALQGRHTEALENYQKAFALIRQTENHLESAYITISLLDGLMHMQRYREAYAMIDTVRAMADRSNAPHLIATVYRTMSDVYKEQGKYKEALEQLDLYITVHDSLVNMDQNGKIAALQNDAELSQKDADFSMKAREAEILDEENDRQRHLMIALAAVLLVALVALILLVVNARARKMANKELRRSNALIQEQFEALRQTNERLTDLNREKDGLIGIVAHDLKSPLNKSSALTELIATVGPLNPSQEQALNMIRTVTAHGSDLIRDLLDLNSIEHPDSELRYEQVDLAGLFREAAATFEAAARQKDLHLHWDPPRDEVSIFTDRSSLNRILENLVSNAVKFSPRSKKIWISASVSAGDPIATGSLSISVRDEGPGISAEDRKKLFKKFQRLSARPTAGESSTGLGLAITKTLTEKLGGTIDVQSKPGMGAEFVVELPGRGGDLG
jgi:signal transduction histidine kinase